MDGLLEDYGCFHEDSKTTFSWVYFLARTRLISFNEQLETTDIFFTSIHENEGIISI